MAGLLIKQAGFVHFATSTKTTATYYFFPGRVGLLRVADHGRARSGNSGIYNKQNPVVANLTFIPPKGTSRIESTNEKATHKIEQAIGRYLIKTGKS